MYIINFGIVRTISDNFGYVTIRFKAIITTSQWWMSMAELQDSLDLECSYYLTSDM